MSKTEKWVILVQNDNGDSSLHGWWKLGENKITPYEYVSKESALREVERLSRYVDSCKAIRKTDEQDGGAE